jgi:hypothetical protein
MYHLLPVRLSQFNVFFIPEFTGTKEQLFVFIMGNFFMKFMHLTKIFPQVTEAVREEDTVRHEITIQVSVINTLM